MAVKKTYQRRKKDECVNNHNTNDKSEVVIHGYANQHHRIIPVVLSNIIIKYFNKSYDTNDKLQIKDILLSKLDFVKSIVTEIENYSSFKECKFCKSITWSNNFGSICASSNCIKENKLLRCPKCLNKFEYGWKCQFTGKCRWRFCKKCYDNKYDIPFFWEDEEYCFDCKYNYCRKHYKSSAYKCCNCSKSGCKNCVPDQNWKTQCAQCNRYFCERCIATKMKPECYGCGKKYDNLCDTCLDKYAEFNDIEIKDCEFVGEVILCTMCSSCDFVNCNYCDKKYLIEEMEEDDNGCFLCLNCDAIKSIQKFNNIEFDL